MSPFGHSSAVFAEALVDDATASTSLWEFGPFRLDADGQLTRNGQSLHLPPKEMAALRLLLDHAGQVVTPAQLKQAIWGQIHVTDDSVPRCLSSLRARLEPDECIQTLYKRGYRLTAPVRAVAATRPAAIPRLALMPLATGPHVPEHLGMAVAEELTTHLLNQHPTAASVLARDSVFSLAAQKLASVELGQILKADLVLTGTLTRYATQLRLRAEMIRVADGVQLWTEEILLPQNALSSLIAALCRRLVLRLGLKPCSTPAHLAPRLLHTPAVRSEAYENLQRGRQQWRTLERHQMQDGLQNLIRATELDPSLLAAKIELVSLCLAQAYSGFMAPVSAARLIESTAASIPDLQRSAPALLPSLGRVRFLIDRNLPAALRDFQLSDHLPHETGTTTSRVHFALSRRLFGPAIERLEEALHQDPFSPGLHGLMAWALHLSGQTTLAVDRLHRALKLFPGHDGVVFYAALILPYARDPQGLRVAQELARVHPHIDAINAFLAYALAVDGQRQQATECLEKLAWIARERFVLRSFSPAAYLALGQPQLAIDELKAANEHRCPWFFQILLDPRLKGLHSHPEFKLLQQEHNRLLATAD